MLILKKCLYFSTQQSWHLLSLGLCKQWFSGPSPKFILLRFKGKGLRNKSCKAEFLWNASSNSILKWLCLYYFITLSIHPSIHSSIHLSIMYLSEAITFYLLLQTITFLLCMWIILMNGNFFPAILASRRSLPLEFGFHISHFTFLFLYAKWSKPGNERQIPYDLTYDWNWRKEIN